MANRRANGAASPRVRPARSGLRAGLDGPGGQDGNKPDGISASEPEALVVSHWFDPGQTGEPYAATIRLTGRRSEVSGKPRPGDSFEHEEKIDHVLPGSGPVSISSWIYGLPPGEWSVSAELTRPRADARGHRMVGSARPDVQALHSTAWSWRYWSASPGPAVVIAKTRWTPIARLARIPAALPGSLPVLVAIGAVTALALQVSLLGNKGVDIIAALLVTGIAAISGLIGAKLWYAVLHPKEPILQPGWAVDGFLVVAPVAAITGLLASGLPVGAYVDAVTPGLFLTVALGRVGCFLTGCCAGRVTASRWGIWSSDQRIGARRIPTQLLESATGLVIGVVTLVLALASDVAGSGVLFATAFAAYLLIRQLLLRLRAQPRRFLWERSRLAPASSAT